VVPNHHADGFQCRKEEVGWREVVLGTKIGETGESENACGHIFRSRFEGHLAYIVQHDSRDILEDRLVANVPVNGLHASGEGTINQRDLIGVDVWTHCQRFKVQKTEIDTFRKEVADRSSRATQCVTIAEGQGFSPPKFVRTSRRGVQGGQLEVFVGGETDTLVEEFGGESVEGFGDQRKGPLCVEGIMKKMRTTQIERVIVVGCCLETLSVDAWPHGYGEDLAPDLYR
jgi:hypothetical protein